jgi:hypothetical protein
MNVISTATDDVFYQKLAALNTAVLGLKQLTPLIYDGSMNYASVVASTTFSPDTFQAQDNNPDSFVGYFRAIDRTHTLDFGAGYKVSANEFQLQVRASFPERIGGVTIFGSNDNETWTRLTPGMTVVMDEMQSLPVQDDLKNLQFRFLKLQMIQPSSTMFELSEFRIFGLRHETINQIATVSMSSAQNLRRRVIAGDTVKLNFQSTNPINNVNVMIQGKPATVTTVDNLNWGASWVVDGTAAAGPVKFKLNYKTEAGQDAIETFGTTDGTSLFISDQSALMTNLLEVTSLKDSSGRNPADLLATVNLLFDKNLSSITDFRLNGGGAGAYLIFDFKEGGLATLSKVEVISRQDNTSGRINGTVVQGSNDGTTWDTISNAAFNSADWQTLTINTAQPYRYIRMYNGNTWFGNMSELRLHGTSISTNKIATASISSDQHLRTRIVPGNTVKVAFTAKEAISDVKATIQGQAATVTTTDNIHFLASAAMPQGVAAGPVKFDIDYKLASGEAGVRNTSTTDNSKLYLVDESDVIRNLPVIATLIDSSVGRPLSTTVGQVNNLADGNLFSISDFRIGSNNSGTGSYITFDFKEGNQVNLTGVELAPRQDSNFGRIRGTVVQGSNDNITWTSLTADAVSTMDWQNLPVSSPVPYRYIRLVNGFAWFGNMSEIRLHGNVHGADVTAPVTTANAPAGWVKQDTTVTLAPSDAGAGVKATYYTVDGGAQQTGTTVTLSAEGAHALVYWSVDWAGNVEAQKTASVNIDKSVPVTTATASPAAPANGWYASDVSLALSVNADAGSSATSYYTVNGGAQQTGNTVVLSAKGTHTVTYWSADQAGNVEAPRSLTFNIGPIDVSASVQMTQLGTVYNRRAGRHIGGITVTNTSGAPLTGPLHLKLNGLAAEFTLDNASGMHGGVPYVTLPSTLNPGASITLPLTFNGPVRSTVSYTPMLLKGNF